MRPSAGHLPPNRHSAGGRTPPASPHPLVGHPRTPPAVRPRTPSAVRPRTPSAVRPWAPSAVRPRAVARSRWMRGALWLLACLCVAGCGGEGASEAAVAQLPDHGEWFWRDVLAQPMAGEAPPRRDILEGEPPSAVVDGLAELVRTQDDAALSTAMAALRHPAPGVAAAAAELLGRSGRRAAIPRLLKSIGPHPVDYDGPIEVRVAAAAALARLGNPAGVPLLLDILAEDTGLQRARAELPWSETTQMVFLRELALPGLEVLAGTDFDYEPNGSVPAREAAVARARAFWDARRIDLWRAAPAPAVDPGFLARTRLLVANLDAYQLRQIDGARFTLTRCGPAVLPQLEEALRAQDDYRRLHVLEVMEGLAAACDAKAKGRLAVVAAGPLLEDPSSSVAAQAARVCGAAQVADPLVQALERRTEGDVLVAVVDALGATERPAAAKVLRQWSAERGGADPADLRVAVAAALWRTDATVPTDDFVALLASPDPSVAYPAVERLVALTGADHGLDPLAPPEARQQALARATAALDARRG